MKEYINKNKYKWLRTFVLISLVLTVAFGGWVYYQCRRGVCYEHNEILKFLVLPFMVLPALMIPFEIASGVGGFRQTEKFFASSPVKKFIESGFVRDWSNKDSKWFLSKLIFTGLFDKHEMILSVENGFLTVVAKADYEHLDKWEPREVKAVIDSFPNLKFSYDADGIATSFKLNDVRKMSYEQLVSYMGEFAEMLERLKVKRQLKPNS